jgi:phage shock protein C
MAEEIKRLYRSRDNRMVGGVAAGLGEFVSVDPTIIRLAFALSFFLWGGGLLIYLIMWVVVPEEPVAGATGTVAAKPAAKKPAASTAPKKSSPPKSES